MFGLIKKIFAGLLTGILNASNHTKCVSLSNQKCMIQPTLINLHPDEYSQEFHNYRFAVKLDWCVRNCYPLNDLSNKVCVANKTGDLNLSVFKMITGIKELTHILCECKCKLGGRKCNSNQWWNNDKYWGECRKRYVWDCVWNPSTCNCENGIYLVSIMGNSVIICCEVINAEAEAESNGKKDTSSKF